MRIDQYHAELLRTDAEYARAAAEVAADPRERLAEEIFQLRMRAGLTQVQVARLARTTQAVVSRLEAAEGNPKLGTISKVLRALRERVASAEASFIQAASTGRTSHWSAYVAPAGDTSVFMPLAVNLGPNAGPWVQASTQDSWDWLSVSSPNADYARAA